MGKSFASGEGARELWECERVVDLVDLSLAVAMTGHFDSHLKLRDLILAKRPKVIVECGAGNGDCTRLLAHMKLMYPFDLYSITDKVLPYMDEVDWKIGLSYEELKDFEDASIGMCIVDTDHNYWTLAQELVVLRDKVEEGGLIVMHDVDDFYHDTGMAMSYWNDAPYPEAEIFECSKHGGLGLALIDFLAKYRGEFQLKHWTPEHHGCAVIEKKTVTGTQVIRPGTNPVFARKL